MAESQVATDEQLADGISALLPKGTDLSALKALQTLNLGNGHHACVCPQSDASLGYRKRAYWGDGKRRSSSRLLSSP